MLQISNVERKKINVRVGINLERSTSNILYLYICSVENDE